MLKAIAIYYNCRLEKSAEEFQTSVDKQKSRVFQEEVRFLRKIIEKAAQKFRRKKLKFEVNKKLKNVFDHLEAIGQIDFELVDNIGNERQGALTDEVKSQSKTMIDSEPVLPFEITPRLSVNKTLSDTDSVDTKSVTPSTRCAENIIIARTITPTKFSDSDINVETRNLTPTKSSENPAVVARSLTPTKFRNENNNSAYNKTSPSQTSNESILITRSSNSTKLSESEGIVEIRSSKPTRPSSETIVVNRSLTPTKFRNDDTIVNKRQSSPSKHNNEKTATTRISIPTKYSNDDSTVATRCVTPTKKIVATRSVTPTKFSNEGSVNVKRCLTPTKVGKRETTSITEPSALLMTTEINQSETNNIKHKQERIPTEDDWIRYRDLELNKTNRTHRKHVNKPKLVTNLDICNKIQSKDRMLILKDICDRLDISNSKELHLHSGNGGSENISEISHEDENGSISVSYKTRNTSNEPFDNHYVSENLSSSDNEREKMNVIEKLNKPKGIIKNWSRGKRDLRRAKSDSSKYSSLRNSISQKKGKGRHVKFAVTDSIHEQSYQEMDEGCYFSDEYQDMDDTCVNDESQKTPHETIYTNDLILQNVCESDPSYHILELTQQFSKEPIQTPSVDTPNIDTVVTAESLNDIIENLQRSVSTEIAISTPHIPVNNTLHKIKDSCDSKGISRSDIKPSHVATEKETVDSKCTCPFEPSTSLHVSPNTPDETSFDELLVDSRESLKLNGLQTNGYKFSNGRIAAYVRRRLKGAESPDNALSMTATPSHLSNVSALDQDNAIRISKRQTIGNDAPSRVTCGITEPHKRTSTSIIEENFVEHTNDKYRHTPTNNIREKHPQHQDRQAFILHNTSSVSDSQNDCYRNMKSNKTRLPSNEEMLFHK